MTQAFPRTMRYCTLQVTFQGGLNTLDLGDGLHAYKITTHVANAKREGNGYTMALPVPEPNSVEQGVVDDANLEKMLAGKAYEKADLILCEPALMEHLRLWGFQEAPEGGYEVFNKKRDDVYDALWSDPAMVDNLVRLSVSSHMAFDRRGEALPTAIWFSYLSGSVSEETYDLEKMAGILLARDDVHVFPKVAGWRDDPDRSGKAATVAECILPIPGYNAGEGRTQTIYFAYRPTAEDHRRLWEKCLSYKTRAPSAQRLRAVMDLDLLGLKAGGAVRQQTA